MHRLIALLLLAALLVAGGDRAAAQFDVADLDPRLAGYPELVIRITPETIELPLQVLAGRTLVVEENTAGGVGHVAVARLPEDLADDQLRADLSVPRRDLGEATPEWFYRSTFVGNPDRAAADGGRVYGLVDLQPGRYLVIDPLHTQRYGRFDAVSASPVMAGTDRTPAADVVAETIDMSFTMPTTIPAGRQVWQIKNAGAALHELAVLPVPAGATKEQVVAAYGAAFAGQPLPAELGAAWTGWNLEALVNGVGVTSPGRTVWAQFDLQPGTYAAICFIPGHLMAGMVQVFTAETPAV